MHLRWENRCTDYRLQPEKGLMVALGAWRFPVRIIDLGPLLRCCI